MRSTVSIITALFITAGGLLFTVCADELDREITRIKKEIERVTAQRKEESSLAKKEQTEFDAYQKRTVEKRLSLTHQTDSMRTATATIHATNDSLSARLHAIELQIREQDLQQERIRESIAGAVSTIASAVAALPPLIAEQYRSPLEYLGSELSGKSVESTEALFRLVRIVQDVRTLSQDIQVVEGSSPVAALRGAVYRLRIGALFEAVVDQQGSRAFIWSRDVSKVQSEQYVAVDDPEVAGAILSAVKIREGKSIPELVRLPLVSDNRAGGAP